MAKKLVFCKECKTELKDTMEDVRKHYAHGLDIFWFKG